MPSAGRGIIAEAPPERMKSIRSFLVACLARLTIFLAPVTAEADGSGCVAEKTSTESGSLGRPAPSGTVIAPSVILSGPRISTIASAIAGAALPPPTSKSLSNRERSTVA